jgi:hypothetical protein
METLLEAGTGYTLHLDDAVPAIINTYTGEQQSSEQFRAHVQRIIHYYKLHKANHPELGYVSDNKNMNALDPADLDWATQNFTPPVIEAGLKGMAFVVSEDVFAQFNIDTFKEDASELGFYVKYYTTREEAKAFVKQRMA